jgi:hypothetical protein
MDAAVITIFETTVAEAFLGVRVSAATALARAGLMATKDGGVTAVFVNRATGAVCTQARDSVATGTTRAAFMAAMVSSAAGITVAALTGVEDSTAAAGTITPVVITTRVDATVVAGITERGAGKRTIRCRGH